MDAKEVCALLPEHPREGMESWAEAHLGRSLGGHLLIYRRASWHPGMEDTDNWFLAFEDQKARWAAECVCTCCGQTWFSGWLGDGIMMFEGEDGQTYSGVPSTDTPSSEIQMSRDGSETHCPWCEETVTVTARRALRRGRTCQIMVSSAETVGALTALVYWIVSRRFSAWGFDRTEVRPCMAVVLHADGTLRRYTHSTVNYRGHLCRRDAWRPLSSLADPGQMRYYSWDAANFTKVGCWVWTDVPDMAGRSGEKTGLADYIADGGAFPFLYLRFWQRFPNAENLIKSGWTDTMDSFISEQVDASVVLRGRRFDYPDDLEVMADWNKSRPADMLSMTKEEVKRGREWKWDRRTMMLWQDFLDCGFAGRGYADEFNRLLTLYGRSDMEDFIGYVSDGRFAWNLTEIDRYLRRQHRRSGLWPSDGLRLFMDYRVILHRLQEHPAGVELWPPDLRAAHDRIMRAEEANNAANYIRGFGEIRSVWGGLEWSDGRICAVLPRVNADLVDEGRTLRHCVGGYGKSHVAGKLVIFIRHARRPERSWFTLNIDTTGDRWREIQLHGYGNERANGKQLRIPEEVRAFVNRWESEILTPVFLDVKKGAVRAANRVRIA